MWPSPRVAAFSPSAIDQLTSAGSPDGSSAVNLACPFEVIATDDGVIENTASFALIPASWPVPHPAANRSRDGSANAMCGLSRFDIRRSWQAESSATILDPTRAGRVNRLSHLNLRRSLGVGNP